MAEIKFERLYVEQPIKKPFGEIISDRARLTFAFTCGIIIANDDLLVNLSNIIAYFFICLAFDIVFYHFKGKF